MIGINRINPALAGRTAPSPAEPQEEGATSDSRALVPVAPASRTQTVHQENRRPLAAFVAQLIATESGAPQTRELRRGTSKEALSRYDAARRGARANHKFSRSM